VEEHDKLLIITHLHGSASILKATKQVNGKGQNSTHRHANTPIPIFTKIGRCDYVLDCTWHAKLGRNRFRSFCSPNTWFCRAFWCD